MTTTRMQAERQAYVLTTNAPKRVTYVAELYLGEWYVRCIDNRKGNK